MSSSEHLAQRVFRDLPDRYDTLAEVLSFGQNGRWRRTMVDAVATTAPARILDVATGTAGVALSLAERTGAAVIGLDVTKPMLERGRQRVLSRGRGRQVHLVQGQAEGLPFRDGEFDALTFTYLLRYVADPGATIRELARVVRPGGLMASLEFAVPEVVPWRMAWYSYTRFLLPVGGFVLGGTNWWRVGRFLGPSISGLYRTYTVPWTAHAWTAAGFEDVTVRRMSLGGGLVMWARKRT